MERRHRNPFSLIPLLAFALATTAAIPQTKTGTTSIPKKLPSVAARTVPPIKCTDPDSVVACKSLKQLVAARDKDLMNSLTGDKDSRERHYAYVCLRPKDDYFKLVKFDEPLSEEYRPYSPSDAANNPVYTLLELKAFPIGGEALPVKQLGELMDAQKKWIEGHDEFHVYQIGWVDVNSWESGILASYISEIGKWSRPSLQGHTSSNEDATFESAHQWLADFNEANANQLASADDREKPRISVDDTNISVRYSYKNKNNDSTDYTLTIQRSTGRFTESFEATGTEPFEDSGTCISLKY